MSIVIEKEGRTASEAAIKACEELGVPRTDVDVEILEEGSKGVFGIGEKKARVKVTVKNDKVSEKGLKARKTLENLLSHLVESYSVSLRETPDKIKLEVNLTDDKGLLIGKRGETLKAMEYLVGKISVINTENGRNKRVYIDIDGYVTKKENNVSKRVADAIKKVKRSRKPVTLEKMSAYERRIAYMTLKRDRAVTYETIEEGNSKKIEIRPQK